MNVVISRKSISNLHTYICTTCYNNPNGRENWLPFFILRLSSSTYFNICCWISTLDFFSFVQCFQNVLADCSIQLFFPLYVIEQQTLYTTKKRDNNNFFFGKMFDIIFFALIFCWEKKHVCSKSSNNLYWIAVISKMIQHNFTK